MKVIKIWECEIDNDEINASSSVFRYVCDSEIKLTWTHNLLIYENQNKYVYVNILTM